MPVKKIYDSFVAAVDTLCTHKTAQTPPRRELNGVEHRWISLIDTLLPASQSFMLEILHPVNMNIIEYPLRDENGEPTGTRHSHRYYLGKHTVQNGETADTYYMSMILDDERAQGESFDKEAHIRTPSNTYRAFYDINAGCLSSQSGKFSILPQTMDFAQHVRGSLETDLLLPSTTKGDVILNDPKDDLQKARLAFICKVYDGSCDAKTAYPMRQFFELYQQQGKLYADALLKTIYEPDRA